MEESLKYQRHLTLVLIFVSFAGLIALVLAAPDTPGYAWGWALGSLTGLGIFRYRAATVLSLFDRPQEEWAQVSIRSSLVSYALTIFVCGGALLLTRYTGIRLFHPYAVLGGVIMERVVLWADGFIRPFIMSPINNEEQV